MSSFTHMYGRNPLPFLHNKAPKPCNNIMSSEKSQHVSYSRNWLYSFPFDKYATKIKNIIGC